MFCRLRSLVLCWRRAVALVTLVLFVGGNIGWPVAPSQTGSTSSATPSPKLLSSPGRSCCCGAGAKSCGCRCATRSVAGALKTRSCCEGKSSGPELIVRCGCGENELPGLILSTQPKLQVACISIPQLVESTSVPEHPEMRLGRQSLSPETPPPRPYVA